MNRPSAPADLVVCILCMLAIMVAIPFVILTLIGFALADYAERLLKPGVRREKD